MGYASKQRIPKTQMAERYLKNFSTFLIFWGMQIKTALKFILTPIKMPMINKISDSSYWEGYRVRGTLTLCW